MLESELAKLPRPIVFTNGCFDILHRGHVTYLAQARNLGKSLVVAVNSDDSVRAQPKAKNSSLRPIIPLGDRVSVIAALESVTLVTWFDDETPQKVIEIVRPEVLVKGGDWSAENIVGGDFVKSYKGSVISIPINYKRSTTDIIAKVLKAQI